MTCLILWIPGGIEIAPVGPPTTSSAGQVTLGGEVTGAVVELVELV